MLSRITLFLCGCFLLFSASVSAQDTSRQLGLHVTSVFSEEDQGDSLKRRVLDVFKEAQAKLLIAEEGDVNMMVLFDSESANIDGSAQIILSVTIGYHLPEAVVAWAGESEAFYLHFASDRKLPEEGKEVRQYMSRDWIKQFVSVSDQRMLIFPEEELESTIFNLISEITRKH